MISEDQRRLLGAFVRARREAAEAPQTGRRRTPGLRREELAARAGISATWCAWIEQGREVRASPHALARLARALGLTRAERAYLFELAGRHDPDVPAPAPGSGVPPSLAEAVSALACPAYGLDAAWNACCWNDAAAALFSGWLVAGTRPNLLRFTFLDPAARRLLPDWETRALRLLAEFRADFGRGLDDPARLALVEDLTGASALFATAWRKQTVLAREGGSRTFFRADGGLGTFRQHTFAPADAPDHKLVILSPVAD